ncbi:Dynamitin-domain-containing protein [Xylariaceae sp. FL0804]|nr:Dynamitin-domain-containing protein [Xylariaceae sp. FL0804]
MAVNRKYADLPDLDSAPDIYETPDLTDDNSTIPTATNRTLSENEFDDGEEEEDADATGISRSRLHIDQARSRFLPAQVDAQDVDFSDRLNVKRKSYRTSSCRQRVRDDGTVEIGDFSDDEHGETLDGKIARLRREIEEAKDEYGRQKAESNGDAPEQDEEFVTLSQSLDAISIQPEMKMFSRPRAPTSTAPPAKQQVQDPAQVIDGATYTLTYSPSYEQNHALAKAADFDRRLALLEKAIGIGHSATELTSSGVPRAIMPTLDTLQRQILTLSEASTSSLDGISRRVRTLTQEAEQLEKSRKAAKAAQDSLGPQGSAAAEADDAEHATKVNALYGTLPTIESLSPLLPPLLDRLRSLRAIHADAATTSETLDRIESQQGEMATDIKQWREGLGKVEKMLDEGQTSMAGNMKTLEGWVKDLEGKMSKLS